MKTRFFDYSNLKKAATLMAAMGFFILFSSGEVRAGIVRLGPDFPVEANNLAPGDTLKRVFFVSTDNDTPMFVSLRFDTDENRPDPETARATIVQIQRPDGSFSKLPSGNGFQRLSELADTGCFIIDTVLGPAEEELAYGLWFTLDPDSVNADQNRTLSLNVRISANIAPNGRNRNIPDHLTTACLLPRNDLNGEVFSHGDDWIPFFLKNTIAIQKDKLSQITAPTLGSGAEDKRLPEKEEIIIEGTGSVSGILCFSLPNKIWFFLLATYCALLIFNIRYQYKKNQEICWFWESLYTILALLAWYRFDGCRRNAWFFVAVLLVAAAVYMSYVHVLNKKAIRDRE